MAVDWLRIKTEYINGNISLRKLAEENAVSYSQMAKVAAAEQWNAQREQQRIKIESKTNQKSAEKISDNESEIASIKSRIRLKIYQELENRLNAEEVEGADFRRLVQSYKDMCEVAFDDGKDRQEGVRVIIDV